MAEKKSILCFGDSLTWGWIPVIEGPSTRRYPYEQRWTGAMASYLGDTCHIVEEGLSARTTSADDPNDPRLNGSACLPTLIASHLPLDLVILLLGTNDIKPFFNRTADDIAGGMAKLVGQVLADFLDAGVFITTDGFDGIHFTAQNNLDLGKAIADKVVAIFEGHPTR